MMQWMRSRQKIYDSKKDSTSVFRLDNDYGHFKSVNKNSRRTKRGVVKVTLQKGNV